MKPHVTNLKHQKFCLLFENVFHKMKGMSLEDNAELTEKMAELRNSREALEDLYSDYQSKLKQLCNLLEEYEKARQSSRIQLRKMQLWLKFNYPE